MSFLAGLAGAAAASLYGDAANEVKKVIPGRTHYVDEAQAIDGDFEADGLNQHVEAPAEPAT